MGVFEFVFGLIVFFTLGSVGIAYLAGRTAFRAGRKLLSWTRERKLLTGEQQGYSQEAQDVVIEDAEVEMGRGPEPPDGHRRAATPAERARAARAAREAEQAHPADYVRLDIDAGTTAEQICEVMEEYTTDPVVGERAEAVIATLSSCDRRRQTLMAELEGTFARGSISWEKFAVPTKAALDAILRNSALLANRIQAFDTAGYLRVFKAVQRDALVAPSTGAKSRSERLEIYKQSLASLDAIQETNEGLLLELDKLAIELGSIQQADESDEGDTILSEIRRLIDEARYYR